MFLSAPEPMKKNLLNDIHDSLSLCEIYTGVLSTVKNNRKTFVTFRYISDRAKGSPKICARAAFTGVQSFQRPERASAIRVACAHSF